MEVAFIMSQYEVRSYEDTYHIYELTDSGSDSRVLVCPERGGIVIGCTLQGRELFYLDKATFLDPAANIRGGNPVLFPICGQLENKAYQWKGKTYSMANHGVARTSSWTVEKTSTEGGASITLSLTSNEETMASYPFPFQLVFTYTLAEGQLHIKQSYRNTGSDEEMPFYAGFHPYFSIEGGKDIPYATDASAYLDYNDNIQKPYSGHLDLEGLVESVAFLDAAANEISFPVAQGVTVKLIYDSIFKYVVLWSVEGKPFVCVEPWMALTGELNRQEHLVKLQPGEKLEAVLTIGCEISSK